MNLDGKLRIVELTVKNPHHQQAYADDSGLLLMMSDFSSRGQAV